MGKKEFKKNSLKYDEILSYNANHRKLQWIGIVEYILFVMHYKKPEINCKERILKITSYMKVSYILIEKTKQRSQCTHMETQGMLNLINLTISINTQITWVRERSHLSSVNCWTYISYFGAMS